MQRWFNGESVGAGGGGNFDPSMISGLAQQSWVEENFVSIEWFDQIFQVFDDTTKLDVNGELPVDQSKLNIKAMFGFWTDFYISALGNGGQVGASITLASLADVNVAGVQNGQVLTWDSATSKWIATTPSSGVDMTVVWNALAANTNEQINASHLSTALSDYATQTWVGQQGFITSTDLTNYMPKMGFNYTVSTIPGWGTLTAANGFSPVAEIGSAPDTNARMAFAYKAAVADHQLSMQIDGFIYQNEGLYKVVDELSIKSLGAGYIEGTNAAANPGGALLRSGANRPDSSPDGDTWIYYDTLGGTTNYWGIRHNQYANTIGFCGNGVQTSSIDLSNGNISCNGNIGASGNISSGGSISATSNITAGGYISATGAITAGGTGTFANVYSYGYVTALSDEREKNIIEDFEIPLDYIANAPIVSYEWKDKKHHDDRQHIGSIAQYWLREMPELVPEVNDRYTMDYGRIALLSAITVARMVVNHEQRLRELERRLINN